MGKGNQTKGASLFFLHPSVKIAAYCPLNSFRGLLDVVASGLQDLGSLNRQIEDMEIANIAKMRPFLSSLLNYYQQELYKIDPVSLGFIHGIPEMHDKMAQQLRTTLFLLHLQYKLDEAEGRNYRLPSLKRQLDYSWDLLSRLEIGKIDTPAKQLKEEVRLSEKPAAYCGLVIVAAFIANKIGDFIDDFKAAKTVSMIQWMNDINERRLYWVWGGGMLQSVLDALPQNMQYLDQARKGLAAPSPYTGYMSWVLYFTRMGINLFMVMKHTIPGSWMSEDEKLIPISERFLTQWNQRKFSLLNDLIWGLVNMACFFWLYGPGKLGYAGNIATVGLLFMDLCLNTWRLIEEQTKYNKFKLEMSIAQEKLQHELFIKKQLLEQAEEEAKKSKNDDLINQLQLEIAQINIKLEDNKRIIAHTEKEWSFKYAGLINEVSYSAGLLIAFSFMVCFMFPPAAIAPATLVILGVTGAAMSFILTAAAAVINGYLEVEKSKEAHEDALNQREALLAKYKAEPDEARRKILFLDIAALEATSQYHLEMAHFQKLQVIRALCVDALIPVIVFASLMFMPLGIGLGVMGAGLALIVISKIIVNQHAPQNPELMQLADSTEEERSSANSLRMVELEDKYTQFVKDNPLLLTPKQSANTESFLFFPKQEAPKLLSASNESSLENKVENKA